MEVAVFERARIALNEKGQSKAFSYEERWRFLPN